MGVGGGRSGWGRGGGWSEPIHYTFFTLRTFAMTTIAAFECVHTSMRSYFS